MSSIEFNGKKYKSFNSFIMHLSKQRPVAYNAELSRLAKSAIAGLFMSQLLYWIGKGYAENYIYKTVKELEKETCLIRSEQERAIKIWKSLGVLVVKRKGIPPIRHFRINSEKLLELLGYSDGDIGRINSIISQNKRIKKQNQEDYYST